MDVDDASAADSKPTTPSPTVELPAADPPSISITVTDATVGTALARSRPNGSSASQSSRSSTTQSEISSSDMSIPVREAPQVMWSWRKLKKNISEKSAICVSGSWWGRQARFRPVYRERPASEPHSCWGATKVPGQPEQEESAPHGLEQKTGGLRQLLNIAAAGKKTVTMKEKEDDERKLSVIL